MKNVCFFESLSKKKFLDFFVKLVLKTNCMIELSAKIYQFIYSTGICFEEEISVEIHFM